MGEEYNRSRRPYQARPREEGSAPRARDRDHGPKRTVEILPSAEVLESYNYIVEGSAKQILDMFEREQRHRHAWEVTALGVHRTTSVLGQVLGFLIAIAMFISASIIGIYGNGIVAASIWIFGLSIVVMAALVWGYARAMGQRPLFARPTMRTHFRPAKEKEAGEEGKPEN